jgi:proteic killer suppression protein
VIKDFADAATQDFYHGIPSKASRKIPSNLAAVAHRKLDMLNAAHELVDLRVPPANRLEALKGDRKGFFSIRVNDQYRVIFKWSEGNAYQVQIADYH